VTRRRELEPDDAGIASWRLMVLRGQGMLVRSSVCYVARDAMPCRATEPGWIGPNDKAGVETGRGSRSKPPDSRNTGNFQGIGQLASLPTGVLVRPGYISKLQPNRDKISPRAVTTRNGVWKPWSGRGGGPELGVSGLCRCGACGKYPICASHPLKEKHDIGDFDMLERRAWCIVEVGGCFSGWCRAV